MWTQARIAIYLTVAFGGVAVILSNMGLADYDSATNMLDLRPIDIKQVAMIMAGPIAAGMAALAAWLGWGAKK